MDTGALVIRMAWRGGRVTELSGVSRRPDAAALLRGKPVDQALALVPLVFSLCGRAQQAVGAGACAVAEGRAAEWPAGVQRACLVEAGQEHLWRLLLDWPQAFSVPALAADFARWHRRLADHARGREGLASADGLADDLSGFLRDAVFGIAVESVLDGAAPAEGSLVALLLDEAARRAPGMPGMSTPPRVLPRQPAAVWAGVLQAADRRFASQPVWQGRPAETGALARHGGNPAVCAALANGQWLLARLLARCCDLAELPARLRHDAVWLDAAAPTPGVGVAATDTARGLLLHRVTVADGVVADYQVIAPTEWNFHPDGAWRHEIEGLSADSAAAAVNRVRQLVGVLDPCVPLRLESISPESDHA